jgi:hypothetical protein
MTYYEYLKVMAKRRWVINSARVLPARNETFVESRMVIHWLDDDGKWNRYSARARLFNSHKEADDYVVEHNLHMGEGSIVAAIASEDLVRGVNKSKAKQKAKKLFGLPATLPDTVIADRFEEEGMYEEVEVLRSKNVATRKNPTEEVR